MNENKKTIDVTALGELLVDFTMNGQSEQGNQIFEACPGGAPCNVLALLQKMGKKTAFIGKVGNDQFGKMLKATIEEAGIDASSLIFDTKVNTTLAFVHTFENGDRDFSFYRNLGADGSRAYYKGQKAEQEGFKVDTIETTGAGDTFCGSALNYILEHNLHNLSEEELAEMLKISNAAAAIVTTRKGALKSMPIREEILSCLRQN